MWLPYYGFAIAAAITPVDAATSDLTNYILGYGPLGIAVLVTAVLLYKGWQLMSPDRQAAMRDECRADLLRENERVLAEKHQAEEQRDEALRVAQEQLVPMLVSFTAATQSLLPLLQELVVSREKAIDREPGRGRR